MVQGCINEGRSYVMSIGKVSNHQQLDNALQMSARTTLQCRENRVTCGQHLPGDQRTKLPPFVKSAKDFRTSGGKKIPEKNGDYQGSPPSQTLKSQYGLGRTDTQL